ncbi:hypothetical protein BJX66DRAFT_315796 [Aspergillus keveii]|uniref:Uncharacterized protein n=1 Tax=Aspergillus keveii TaxID=714993 RepID=A0ABR4FNY0_9EURO
MVRVLFLGMDCRVHRAGRWRHQECSNRLGCRRDGHGLTESLLSAVSLCLVLKLQARYYCDVQPHSRPGVGF